ncbi:Humicola Insolens Endocellulase Egi S37w, P39w double-mutant [Lasiosphaeris hirsuta]|uniref:Glucanase n=1 Tax=Lasiosphaeris hirsuta TaxID=260670 RepID=A0AA40A9E9_9PEZI|nr:Humicola Insolens Endocellulase Egi S37w, P39w double-mutant [Lasiosphaeris hirsuta]
MEGVADYSRYGVTTAGSALRLQHILDGKVVSPRVYLLDASEHKYEMLQLTGREFAFDVEASKLPCGMNSALYLSEMEAEGGKSALNTGGAYYGTGYCDAQCFVTPFINGVGNIEGKGSCCNEMDIWEANSRSNHIAPHTCSKPGLYQCTGAECESAGVCDKNGCAWNPRRVKIDNVFGRGDGFKVNTLRPFTVITQFPAGADGRLKEINRVYVQDGKVIENYVVKSAGLPEVSALNDAFCNATKSDSYLRLGGTPGMGDALARGMVLATSIWWDEGGNMTWLDAGEAGPCNTTEGNPSSVVKVEPNPEVTFSNIKWGEIGSTYKKGLKYRRSQKLY